MPQLHSHRMQAVGCQSLSWSVIGGFAFLRVADFRTREGTRSWAWTVSSGFEVMRPRGP